MIKLNMLNIINTFHFQHLRYLNKIVKSHQNKLHLHHKASIASSIDQLLNGDDCLLVQQNYLYNIGICLTSNLIGLLKHHAFTSD